MYLSTLVFLLMIVLYFVHYSYLNLLCSAAVLILDLSYRLHRGRSGRSFSRSNSRNRSTSRAPLCHRTTPSDQPGGSSGHQPMNVALPNEQRPIQTKAKAKGDMQGWPAAPGSKPKNFARGDTSESQRLRALCALPALWEQIDWEKSYWSLKKKKINKETKRPKKKNLQERRKWQKIWELLSSRFKKKLVCLPA